MTDQSGEHYPQRTRIGDQAVTLPRSADPIDADQSGRHALQRKIKLTPRRSPSARFG
jgi:hypothetical protein